MTNGIALVLALMILALFVLDATVLHLGMAVEIGRLFAQLVDWVSFWD